MDIREKIETFERLTFIEKATFSDKSLGREKDESEDVVRTCFMVDRDRIIHCKSFRRLKHKTQVYIKTFGDHYRTRLTHTLEVAQIARTIGAGIRLNETLIEAIALGHDLGHVAFAHNGEEVLNEFLPNGFRHNEQSVRVVTKLENEGKGLNLTKEVIDGILHHSGLRSASDDKGALTLEGRVVQVSDKIAYINHDIDDSIRAGLLSENDIPKELLKALGKTHSERIETLVLDFINTSNKNLEEGINSVGLSKEIEEAMRELRAFMFKNIYLSNELKGERNKAKFILNELINHYMEHIEEMPELYRNIVECEGEKRGVADYIAGMSDDYCLSQFNKIFVPKLVIY
ncbi:MAG: deoxyguanosinetriphosphate triphosphohydrolase [Clostridium sp.]|uniref:Deoxyguanosinetriphosphate triphosphohydrolase-like protein n=1 Tax=Clostridium paraputrificum TaxID=29363 RepID=A0A6N3GT14_9CLOT|nr:deoxyguanosinetriphosphate triphosphohydrolase [Clostridium sp.]MBS5925617.1 deoxyguanosinetriphosphate triphosphohydrolase [Clostridium sp.]MBS5986176.1 deoxyguanosinetriphosphate triphosphohydrolase [Clostridium sp.]